MLREEINHVLDIFDSYQMTEEQQKRVLLHGIDFDFTWGDPDPTNRNRKLDCFEAAKFLEMCRDINIDIDVDHLLSTPYDAKYEKILGVMGSIDEFRDKARQNKKPNRVSKIINED